MSKSDPSDHSRINLTDDADTIAQKIRRAKTDPEPLPSEEKGLEGRPEADNLVGIYAALADTTQAPTCCSNSAARSSPPSRPRWPTWRSPSSARSAPRCSGSSPTRPMIDAMLADGSARARSDRRRDHEGRQGYRRLRARADRHARGIRHVRRAATAEAVGLDARLAAHPCRHGDGMAIALAARHRGSVGIAAVRERRMSHDASAAATKLATSRNSWSSSTTRRNATAPVYFASRRAARIGGSVAHAAVIETHDRTSNGSASPTSCGARRSALKPDAATRIDDRRARRRRRHHARTGGPRGRHGRGDPEADRRGRGYRRSWSWPPAPATKVRDRWSRISARPPASYPIPVAIVPGHLSDEDLDALS